MKYVEPEIEILEVEKNIFVTMSGAGNVGESVSGEVIDKIGNESTDVW